MVDATVRDKVVLESELAGLVELADALRSQVLCPPALPDRTG